MSEDRGDGHGEREFREEGDPDERQPLDLLAFIPRRLRKRVTSDAPARIAATRAAIPVISLRMMITRPAPAMPVGLITLTVVRSANAPVIRPGVRANKSAVTAGAAQASHSTGRHRRDGTRPSGKSRNSRIGMDRVGTIAQRSIQAAARPAGSEPGAVTSA